MAGTLKAFVMSDDGKKQHSSALAQSLKQAAKSLGTRPNGLRGPFAVKTASQGEKKK